MTENHLKTSFTFLLALVAFRRKTLHNSGAEARALSDLCAVSARRATGANRKIHFEVTSGDLPPPFCYSGRQKCLPGGAPTCPTGEALFPTAVAKSEHPISGKVDFSKSSLFATAVGKRASPVGHQHAPPGKPFSRPL